MSALDLLGYDDTRADPDDYLRELLEKQHLIREMQETPGWALWRDFLAAEQEGYQRRLLAGRHGDMLEYKRDAGFCQGIRFALGASEELAARIAAVRANMGAIADTEGEAE